ncbi:MAG: multidrug effflux MFS transporter [Rhodospirillales bacterium]|nr:multidrug effflux MFS transporter [Rhodospirillales bacterium]
MRVPRWLPPLLGFLTAVGPASTDMYLPAFPAIEAGLHAPPGAAQYTLAAWFAGLAVGQLTQGTLSDRLGRRVPLLGAGVVYTASCAACALAPSILALSLLRVVAAVAASAGMVIPRAMVRDLAEGHEAARLLSRLMLVMGVAPILAPSIGGAVLIWGSWRWIFWVMAGYGAISLLLVALLLPDTLPPEARLRLSAGQLLARYRAILRERQFRAHAAMGAAGTFAFFAYLGGSSPVFIDGFGFSPSGFGLLFGACAMGLIGSAQINARLLGRFGIGRSLRFVARAYVLAALALVVVAFLRVHVFAAVFAPVFVMVSLQGVLNPNAAAGALARQAAQAGSASAVMGTMQFLMGAASGLLVGIFTDGTPRGMAALMLVGAIGLLLADRARARAS